jgi:hypothetical protein
MENQNKKNIIETFGTISKREILASLEEEFCNGALVLESKFPFPGYYHNTIPDKKVLDPGSIFLMTRKTHQDEEIMRLNHEVKKSFKKRFDATVGKLVVFNETRPCIRIKFLKDYSDIPELVDLYRKNGIQFLKYRKVKPYYDLIKIRKYFVLESEDPGFYLDAEEPHMCYFQIPAFLKWSDFEKITLAMKRNMDEHKWDAAMGTIYRKNCLVDLVRIYDEHVDKEKIMFIKSKYLEAIKKLNTK